jgi:hypothetical protein
MPKGPFRGRSRFVPAGLGFSEPSAFSAEQMENDPDELGTKKPTKKRKPDYITDTESLLEQSP